MVKRCRCRSQHSSRVSPTKRPEFMINSLGQGPSPRPSPAQRLHLRRGSPASTTAARPARFRPRRRAPAPTHTTSSPSCSKPPSPPSTPRTITTTSRIEPSIFVRLHLRVLHGDLQGPEAEADSPSGPPPPAPPRRPSRPTMGWRVNGEIDPPADRQQLSSRAPSPRNDGRGTQPPCPCFRPPQVRPQPAGSCPSPRLVHRPRRHDHLHQAAR